MYKKTLFYMRRLREVTPPRRGLMAKEEETPMVMAQQQERKMPGSMPILIITRCLHCCPLMAMAIREGEEEEEREEEEGQVGVFPTPLVAALPPPPGIKA